MIIVSYIYLCSIMKMKYKNDKMRFFNKYVVVAGFVSTGSIPVCIVPLTKKKFVTVRVCPSVSRW